MCPSRLQTCSSRGAEAPNLSARSVVVYGRLPAYDDLVGHAVQFHVAGAQNFVTGDDVADRGDQRVDVPRSGQLRRKRNVVDRTGPVDAVGEPAAQLRCL